MPQSLTHPLTPDGPALSRLVAGMMSLADWNLTAVKRLNWIHAMLDLGVTTFDHADIYGSYSCEQLFGEALALEPGLRQQMQLVTKCDIKLISPNRPEHTIKHYDTSAAHIITSVNNSLRNLQTDVIDLLLIHRPDPLLNPDEVAAAFTQLKAAGKVRHFGVSNFAPSQFDMLASRLDVPLVTNQVELSVAQMAALHDGTLDHCLQHRYVPMAWSPFGSGRIFWADDEQSVRIRQTMQQIGQELDGATLDQVALAWLLTHPAGVMPVLGTGKLDRWQRMVAAADLRLTRPQWFAIWQASMGHEVP